MRNIIRTTLAAGVLMVAAACTDPSVAPKSTVSGANIFSEASSYKAFLAKVYAGLATSGQQGPAGAGDIQGLDEGFSQYLRLYWEMQELPSDEAALAWNDGPVQELNTQNWSSSNGFLGSMYYRVYFQVSMANEFLRNTTDAALAANNATPAVIAAVKSYRAEARYLRALSYWHGMDLFGGIPLVTEADVIGKTPPAQKSRTEVFNFIVSELNAIRVDLPVAGAQEYGRVDQGAVAMLLAKVYLNAAVYTGTARYTDAMTEISKVVAGPYSIDPNYLRMFSADNNTSPEFIFAVPQDGKKIQSYGGTTFLVHANIGGNMDASKYGVDGGWYGLRLKPEAVALYPNGGGPAGPDGRASYFFSNGQTLAMGNLTDFSNGIGAPKFRNVTSTGAPGSDKGFVDTDYPMFRLGDAYLMYAEAALRGGGGTRAQALTYVNALRQRAYGNANGNITDAQLTLDFILAERGRELLWEGHRRQDLIRFGQFSTGGIWAWKGNVLAGKLTQAFKDLYPLPASELIANPNLKQNTGY
jgi:hypothetical protein